MAYQQYPEYTGQKETGWYQVPGKGTRYHAGNGEFRYTNAGTGDGPTSFELFPFLTQNAGQKMTPEREARSGAQEAYNNGDRSQATLHTLYPDRYGPPGSGPGKKPETPASPATGDTPVAPANTDDSPAAPVTPAAPATPTGRDVESPSGNGARGTQTGPRGATMDEVNSLLAGQGVGPLRNPFTSNNLPGTEGYTPANTENQTGNQNIGPVAEGDQYARMLESARTGDQSAITPADTANPEGIAKPPAPRRSGNYRPDPSGEGIGAFNDDDTAITGPDPASYATSNSEVQRRSAFMNAPDSLSGLRAVEANAGVFVAGGNYYTANPNAGQEGQNALTQISRENADTLKDGGDGAQQFLQQKLADLQGDSQFSETLPPEVTVDGVNGSNKKNTDPESRNVPGRRFQPGGGFA